MAKTISIQGGIGSFSHIAASELFGEDINLLKRDAFKKTFEDCNSSEDILAVIPFENSTHGSVMENYDYVSRFSLNIFAEIYLKINFHLIALPGSKIEEITDLFTHRVSLSQIKGFLEKNKQIEPHIYSDNGKAVEFVKKEANSNYSAAASKFASQMFDMEVLVRNIHDNPKNYTRFFALAKTKDFPEEYNKVSLSFEIKHAPGMLARVLNVFGERGVNLTKIESRPILDTVWEYRFYVDIYKEKINLDFDSIVEEIGKHTNKLSVLGRYKSGEYIDT